MKNLTKLFLALILLTGFTFTQERPDKSKDMIITPDEKTNVKNRWEYY